MHAMFGFGHFNSFINVNKFNVLTSWQKTANAREHVKGKSFSSGEMLSSLNFEGFFPVQIFI